MFNVAYELGVASVLIRYTAMTLFDGCSLTHSLHRPFSDVVRTPAFRGRFPSVRTHARLRKRKEIFQWRDGRRCAGYLARLVLQVCSSGWVPAYCHGWCEAMNEAVRVALETFEKVDYSGLNSGGGTSRIGMRRMLFIDSLTILVCICSSTSRA